MNHMNKMETMSAQFGYSLFLHALVLIPLLTLHVDPSATKKWSWEGFVIHVTMKEAVPKSRPPTTTSRRDKPAPAVERRSRETRVPVRSQPEAAAQPAAPYGPALSQIKEPPPQAIRKMPDLSQAGGADKAETGRMRKPKELKKEHSEGGSSGEAIKATHANIGTSGKKALREVRPHADEQKPSQNTRTGTPMPQQSVFSNPLPEQSPPVTDSFPLLSSKAADTGGAVELRPFKEAPVDISGETKPKEKEAVLIVDHKTHAEKPSVVLPISPTEPLRIEISLREGGLEDIRVNLMKKSYPSAGRPSRNEKEQEVEMREDSRTVSAEDGSGPKEVFSVPAVTRAGYTLGIKKRGEAPCVADVAFLFFEGRKKVRVKEYRAVHISGETEAKFRFIYPDAIFWDDDDRFGGSIEDSGSVTKFNDETGLFWREEKDR